MSADHAHVLFICTGNFYRSRFAEAVFNHLAAQANVPWRAFSRGVAIHLAPPGLSPHTAAALTARGIPHALTSAERAQLTEDDLRRARHIVALKKDEHRPYLVRLFPAWAERVEYWHFHDVDFSAATEVLPEIEIRVRHLLQQVGRT